MSTRVVKVIVCDRCRREDQADYVTSIPDGWNTLLSGSGVTRHLCRECSQRSLRLTEDKG